MHVKKLAVRLSWEGETHKPWRFPLRFASLGEEPFSLRAVFGCDYVIHQGITIKGRGGGVSRGWKVIVVLLMIIV